MCETQNRRRFRARPAQNEAGFSQPTIRASSQMDFD
jgi:hypothetical protein